MKMYNSELVLTTKHIQSKATVSLPMACTKNCRKSHTELKSMETFAGE